MRASAGRHGISDIGFSFVRHNERNETTWSCFDDEVGPLADLEARSALLGARLRRHGGEVRLESLWAGRPPAHRNA